MKPTWIVVADGYRARFFARTSATAPLAPMTSMVHPQARLKAGELEDDRLGHANRDGAGGTAFAPHTEVKEKARAQFAREVAQRLNDGVSDHRCSGVMLFAPSDMLGELRRHLHPDTLARIEDEAAADWTACGEADLARRIADHGRSRHRAAHE